jgi:hypothetical protein
MRGLPDGRLPCTESPAGVAQQAEQPSCKRQVSGSNPLTGSQFSSGIDLTSSPIRGTNNADPDYPSGLSSRYVEGRQGSHKATAQRVFPGLRARRDRSAHQTRSASRPQRRPSNPDHVFRRGVSDLYRVIQWDSCRLCQGPIAGIDLRGSRSRGHGYRARAVTALAPFARSS